MDKPTPLSSIRDGTSNTILFAESSEPVEWTRPEGLSIDAPGSLGLGSKHPGGFDAAFADGSIHFLTSKVSVQTLKALITKAGGEEVNR
jgi:prepilin-type processing-associated H-X9-DG protein